MSDPRNECQYCLYIQSRDIKSVTGLMEYRTIQHNGQLVYELTITLGGDRQKIAELVEVVRGYMANVLGVPEVYRDGIPPVRKPH